MLKTTHQNYGGLLFVITNPKNLKEKAPAGPLSADSSCRCFSDEDASDNRRNPRLRVAKDSASRYITLDGGCLGRVV